MSNGYRLALQLRGLRQGDAQQEAWLAAVGPDAAPVRVDREEATRAAHSLADAYWSLSRLFIQTLTFIVVSFVLLFCTTSIGALIASPDTDAGALALFIIGMALAGAWMIWMLVRTTRATARFRAGAVAWSALARSRGAAVDISGGWRRGVRIAFGVIGTLLSALALLIAASAGYASDLGMTGSYIVFLVAVGAAGAALSLVVLVGAARGLTRR